MNNDLISRSELKKALRQRQWHIDDIEEVEKIIDNAPTVEVGYLTNCANCERVEKIRAKRPHGECRTCRHRDPEDKKCDCGGKERQGCPFPVSDDYFCKFYEKGGVK